jgi:hypothetical protein
MTRDELYIALERAQGLLSEVYAFAGNNGLHELESLMSVADTCIVDAFEEIECGLESMNVSPYNIVVGGFYNWKYQPQRLVYLGKVGSWHQFALTISPDKVWCEVIDNDLKSFEVSEQ